MFSSSLLGFLKIFPSKKTDTCRMWLWSLRRKQAGLGARSKKPMPLIPTSALGPLCNSKQGWQPRDRTLIWYKSWLVTTAYKVILAKKGRHIALWEQSHKKNNVPSQVKVLLQRKNQQSQSPNWFVCWVYQNSLSPRSRLRWCLPLQTRESNVRKRFRFFSVVLHWDVEWKHHNRHNLLSLWHDMMY